MEAEEERKEDQPRLDPERRFSPKNLTEATGRWCWKETAGNVWDRGEGRPRALAEETQEGDPGQVEVDEGSTSLGLPRAREVDLP